MNVIRYLSQHSGKFGKLQVAGLPIEAKTARDVDFHGPLQKGISILNDLGHRYFISAGTALGFIRDKTFIPHDCDIDVEVVTSYDTKIDYEDIIKSFIEEGFFVVRTVFDGEYAQQIAFMNKEAAVFDIWFIYSDVIDGYYVNHTEYGPMKTPKHFVDNAKVRSVTVAQSKYDLPLPTPEEDYCECRYGLDWKTPKKSKGPWQDDAGNLS
jgi:fukutin